MSREERKRRGRRTSCQKQDGENGRGGQKTRQSDKQLLSRGDIDKSIRKIKTEEKTAEGAALVSDC